jgi:hypothetical protein
MDYSVLNDKTVEAVFMDEKNLTFVTDSGDVSFAVAGECCSKSYFFDFYGIKNLLGSKVVKFEKVDLSPGDPGYNKRTYNTKPKGNLKGKAAKKAQEEPRVFTKVYGYRFTTLHPIFGPVSSVLSFRNDSNGYYGGRMEESLKYIKDESARLTKDKIG